MLVEQQLTIRIFMVYTACKNRMVVDHISLLRFCSFGTLPGLSTYNLIYGMYSPIYNQLPPLEMSTLD